MAMENSATGTPTRARVEGIADAAEPRDVCVRCSRGPPRPQIGRRPETSYLEASRHQLEVRIFLCLIRGASAKIR